MVQDITARTRPVSVRVRGLGEFPTARGDAFGVTSGEEFALVASERVEPANDAVEALEEVDALLPLPYPFCKTDELDTLCFVSITGFATLTGASAASSGALEFGGLRILLLSRNTPRGVDTCPDL
jgi:hypothetical protein